VTVAPCAGADHSMLSISGIVPNGVASAFLTAPDGTAVRADVKDNGYEFLLPSPRPYEERYVVWTRWRRDAPRPARRHLRPLERQELRGPGEAGEVAGTGLTRRLRRLHDAARPDPWRTSSGRPPAAACAAAPASDEQVPLRRPLLGGGPARARARGARPRRSGPARGRRARRLRPGAARGPRPARPSASRPRAPAQATLTVVRQATG
jgi:hypothetical protein